MPSDKRYQVFISSTFLDLQAERHAVTMALLQLDCFPSGMELFPAANDDAWTLIKRVIAECDYYLLVIGGRYGSTAADSGLSYTEREYDHAVTLGKPVMAFLHGERGVTPAPDPSAPPAAHRRLVEFRTKVENTHVVNYWRSTDDLARQVVLSLMHFVREYQAVGWIRANAQDSRETLAELEKARRRIAELEAASVAPPLGAADLSQGDDRVEVECECSGKFAGTVVGVSGQWPGSGGRVRLSVSWNSIITALSTQLLDPTSSDQLEARLAGSLVNYIDPAALDEAILRGVRQLSLPHLSDEQFESAANGVVLRESCHILPNDLDTITLQLMALGILKRTVVEGRVFWQFTPFGADQFIRLKTIRRSY